MTTTLRGFALAVYAADGVDRACLLLQGRLGLDVNLLLFAAYAGVARGRVPTCAVLGAAAERVGAWHQEVVRPLRSVRQRLKSGPAPAPNPATALLREQVKELEIQAELIELDGLAPPGAVAPGDAIDRAYAALEIVVQATGHRHTTDDERDALTTIALAAARQIGRIP